MYTHVIQDSSAWVCAETWGVTEAETVISSHANPAMLQPCSVRGMYEIFMLNYISSVTCPPCRKLSDGEGLVVICWCADRIQHPVLFVTPTFHLWSTLQLSSVESACRQDAGVNLPPGVLHPSCLTVCRHCQQGSPQGGGGAAMWTAAVCSNTVTLSPAVMWNYCCK